MLRLSAARRSLARLYCMATQQHGPVGAMVGAKLTEEFRPSELQVVNESHMHNVPRGAETHFKVLVVSPAFQGLPLIQRHRKVNAVLAQELAGGVHALSIVAKTPQEWEKSCGGVEPSPACRGGFGK